MKFEPKLYKVKYYDKIKSKKVDWLWYPYIPYGKITIIQGDPGDGKSTLALNLLAMVTNGAELPFSKKKLEKSCVVYQNNEDGKEDTIDPRMMACGADLSRIAYVDESEDVFSMGDERIEQVLDETAARVIILDPIQAYLGDTDMNRAAEIRPVFRRLAAIAQRKSCAVILIGHMSKGNGKGLYRGLGSIDIAAVARSVLLVSKIDENLRVLAPIKNNLAPMGDSILFQIYGNSQIKWIKTCKITAEQIINGETDEIEYSSNKIIHAINIITFCIKNGTNKAKDIQKECEKQGVSVRTVNTAKSRMNIKSIKTKDGWIWQIEDKEESIGDGQQTE